MRTLVRSLTVLLVLLPLSLSAGDEKAAKQQADQQAAMEAMIKAGTPGAPHKHLAGMEGTWSATVKFWEGGQEMVSKGTSWNKMILGGRWLEQRFESDMMGQKFEGVGYTGYDNIRKEYVATWMDTMTTGMMTSTGQPGKAPATWELKGTMDDPLTGKASDVVSVHTEKSSDVHLFEMFGVAPDGSRQKMMEIEYVRKK